MKTCDYCGARDIAGTRLHQKVLLRWGRYTLTLSREAVRVCMKHLVEGSAPLTAETLAKIAEAIDAQREERER